MTTHDEWNVERASIQKAWEDKMIQQGYAELERRKLMEKLWEVTQQERYDTNRKQESYDTDKDSSSQKKQEGGSGCYIATATLTGGGSPLYLEALRTWRDKVMHATSWGRALERFYDRTGPVVAVQVQRNKALAASFLYPFVKPAAWMAQRRFRSRWGVLYDILIYIVFLTGLAYGTLIYLVSHLIFAHNSNGPTEKSSGELVTQHKRLDGDDV